MKSLAPKILLLIAIAVLPTLAAAQDFRFEPPTNSTDPALPAALRDLAQRIVPVYKDVSSDRYLANLAALQMVAGDPAAAHATRLSLQKRLRSEQRAPPARRAVVNDIYTQARAVEATQHVPFASAYAKAFRDTLNRLNDLDAYELEGELMKPTEPLRNTLQRALDQRRGKNPSCSRNTRTRAGLVRVRRLSQFRRHRTTAPRRRQRGALRHRRDHDSRFEGCDDRSNVGPSAERYRRRSHTADAA
jgi:hypothetical protein